MGYAPDLLPYDPSSFIPSQGVPLHPTMSPPHGRLPLPFKAPEVRLDRPQLCVGWLDSRFGFPTRAPDDELVARLWRIAAYSVRPMRGSHSCEFCSQRALYKEISAGAFVSVGHAELVVTDGLVWYVAPNMVAHYVEAHGYDPPEGFRRAVLEGPEPFSLEYERTLARYTEGAGIHPAFRRVGAGPPRFM